MRKKPVWSVRISYAFKVIYILLAEGIKNGTLKVLKVGNGWKLFYICRKKQATDKVSDKNGEITENIEKKSISNGKPLVICADVYKIQM